MKKLICVVLVAIMLISVLSLFCGCSGGGISGRWVAKDYDERNSEMRHNMPTELELFSDGKGTARIPYFTGGGLDISWSAEGNRLKISSFGSSFTYDYQIKGGVLTLQYREYSVSYTRK